MDNIGEIGQRADAFATQTVTTLKGFAEQDRAEGKVGNGVTAKGLFMTWDKIQEMVAFSYRAAIEMEKYANPR